MEIHTQWYKNKATLLFMVLGGFFITNALIAELIGIKIFSLEKIFGLHPFNMTLFGVTDLGFNLTAGVILWPVVFVMTDIINEYFGRRGVQMLSWMAVVMIVYAFFMFFLGIHLPPNDWWQNESGLITTNPDQSKQIALQRIQQLDEREMPAIQDAAVGLAKAMQTGVDRTPAILFDGEAVVYGLTDLGVALDHYRTWRSGARP